MRCIYSREGPVRPRRVRTQSGLGKARRTPRNITFPDFGENRSRCSIDVLRALVCCTWSKLYITQVASEPVTDRRCKISAAQVFNQLEHITLTMYNLLVTVWDESKWYDTPVHLEPPAAVANAST